MDCLWNIDNIKSLCVEFISNCFILKEIDCCYQYLSTEVVLVDEEQNIAINNDEVIINYLLNAKKFNGYQILNIHANKIDQYLGVVSITLYKKNLYKIPITFTCKVEKENIKIEKIYIEKVKSISSYSYEKELELDVSEIFEINEKVDVERENLINSIDGGYCRFKIENQKITPLSFSYKLPSFFGYSRKEFSHLFYHNIIASFPRSSRKVLFEEINKSINSNKPYSTTIEILNKKGEIIACFMTMKKVYDLNGSEILNVLILGKNYEVKLNKDILNYMSTGIIVIQKNNNIIFTNDVAKNYLSKYDEIKKLNNPLLLNDYKSNPNKFGEIVYEVKSVNGVFFEIKEKEIEWLGDSVLIRVINDITAKKRILKSIKENTKKLDIAINSLNAFYWTYLPYRDSLIIDNLYKDNFNLESNFIINFKSYLSQLDFINPLDINTFFKEIEKCINGEPSTIFCVRIRLKKGEKYRWCKLSNNLINEETESSKILITIQDISEDMTSMKQYLNISEQFEYQASDNIVSYIVNLSQNKIDKIISIRGDFDYNKFVKATQLYEFSKNCRLSNYNKDKDEKYSDINYLINAFHEGKNSFEYIVNYSINEKKMWVRKYVTLVKNPISNDIIAFHSIKDATNEILTNQILDYIVEKHFDFIVRVNLITKKCNLIINPKYAPKKDETRYILSIKEFINLIYKRGDLFVPSEEQYIELLYKKLRNSYYFEDYIEYVENESKVRKKINLYKLDDIEDSVIVVCADITALTLADNKKTETLSIALERANQANNAKTTFLSAMSHDIRTPINAIIGMTDLAIENLDDKDQLNQSFEIIKNSSKHLLELINEILEMSAIESGKHIVKNEPINISEIIKKVLQRLNSIAKNKNINIQYSTNIENPNLLGDGLAITRIIENISNNAIKFTPNNGNIKIIVEEKLDNIFNNDILQITITDSGYGIKKENLDKIFDSFYRSGNAAKGDVEGTGLGLSITKGLVDSLKGNIRVESEINQGTSFFIELPIIKLSKNLRKERKKESNIIVEKVLKGFNILLVEDHPINSLVAQKMLSNLGLNVICANDGKEAVEIFEHSKENFFDIIFMDIQMPNIDGFEATKIIRNLNRADSKNVAIIAMTANAFAEDVKKCLDIGMDSHIAKPIDINVVIREILKIYNKKYPKSI